MKDAISQYFDITDFKLTIPFAFIGNVFFEQIILMFVAAAAPIIVKGIIKITTDQYTKWHARRKNNADS